MTVVWIMMVLAVVLLVLASLPIWPDGPQPPPPPPEPMDPGLAAELMRPAATWIAEAEDEASRRWLVEYGFIPDGEGPVWVSAYHVHG